MKVIPETHRVR